MATTVVLIRHAAVDTAGRLCGWLDLPLSARGRADLRDLLGRAAQTVAPDALFTSSLTRATEVARELGRCWKLAPVPADWAREIYCGDVEGMLLDELQRRYPDLWSRNEAELDDGFAWPGGETYTAFRARVLSGIDTIAAQYPTGRVAVVTHAGVISQVLGVARGRPPCVWRPDRPRPLTATEVLWADGAPRAVLSFSDPDWY